MFLFDLFFFNGFLSYFITVADMSSPTIVGGILLLFLVRVAFIAALIFSIKLSPKFNPPQKIVIKEKRWHALFLVVTYHVSATLVYFLNPIHVLPLFAFGIFISVSLLLIELKSYRY